MNAKPLAASVCPSHSCAQTDTADTWAAALPDHPSIASAKPSATTLATSNAGSLSGASIVLREVMPRSPSLHNTLPHNQELTQP